jgi:DNA mismatch repair protein PMS2
MLQDGGGQSYVVGKKRSKPDGGQVAQAVPRPSKVRAMLAMRACRGSIMIGKALSRAQMQQTVARLADLDSPWNCPHGRPTMRHVCGLRPSS